MYKKQFKMMGARGKELSIYAENYMNTNEIAMVAKTRPLNRNFSRYDFFVDKKYSSDEDWYGFYRSEELLEMMAKGIKDNDAISNLQRYAHKAMVEEKDKYSRTVLGVAGGGVNVPLLLSGSPECMYSRAKAPVKTKIINMGIHNEIVCGITQERYRHAGMLVAQLVSKLEKAGYRLRINMMDAYYNNTPKICVLTSVIKRENEPMNYARILYPLTSVASSRGMGFAWAARNPDFTMSDLGTYAEFAFDSDGQKMDEMFEMATGLKGFTSFKIKDLIDMYRERGDDATMKYMESRLMASVE